MGVAAYNRSSQVIRTILATEAHEKEAAFLNKAFAEITIVGKTLEGKWDIACWFESYDGVLFSGCRIALGTLHGMHQEVHRHFHYFCGQPGLIAERVSWPASNVAYTTRGTCDDLPTL